MTGSTVKQYGERGLPTSHEATVDGYRRFVADRERRKRAAAIARERAEWNRTPAPVLAQLLGQKDDELRLVIARGAVPGWSIVGNGRVVRVPELAAVEDEAVAA